MAADGAKVVDAVPPPPAYYKLFALDAARAPASSSSREASDSIQHPAVPSSLATATHTRDAEDGFPLQPPPPPGPGETFKMFGMPYSAEPVAEELLPPEKMVVPTSSQHIDFRAEMKTLLNSIMANYGQFMEMLVCAPSRTHEKVSDLETLFVNFHSLLNRYRAHQARHLILERLRSQAEENVAAMAALESAIRDSLSAQERASACLRPTNGTVTTGAAAIEVPMDVAEEGFTSGSWQAMDGMDGSAGVVRASQREAFAGNGVGSVADEHFRGRGGF